MTRRLSHNLICLVATVAFATFAVPGIAQTLNKHYSLNMVPGTPEILQEKTVITATIWNDNPSNSNAQIGSFTLSVANVAGITITSGEKDPDLGGTVSLPFNDGKSISVTGFNPLKPGDYYKLTLYVKGCGDPLWDAVVWSGSNLNGGTYELTNSNNVSARTTEIPCGELACNTVFTVGGTNVSGERGRYNKDGGTCRGTNYYVTTYLANQSLDKLHFRWITDEKVATFRYTVADRLGKVAWLVDVDGQPDFVPALDCDANKPELPAPYGTLISDNGSKQIKVDTSAAWLGKHALPSPIPASGFPIVIDKERMQVVKVSGQTWTVVRATGNTSPIKHETGRPVMSTPLPIIPNSPPWNTYINLYAPGNFAQMCIPPGGKPWANDPPGASITTLIDIGDGWSKP